MSEGSRRFPTYLTLAVVLAVAAGLAVGLRPASSATTDWVANPVFASNTGSWTVSSGGLLRRKVSDDRTTYADLKSGSGRRDVTMTSDPSTARFTAGSNLGVSVRFRTPRTTVKVTIEAREIDSHGAVVGTTTWSSSQSTTAYRVAELTLAARQSDSQFSLRITGHALNDDRRVRVREIVAGLVGSPSPSATPTATPTPSPIPMPTPTSTATEPPPGDGQVRSCTATQVQELGYHRAGQGELAFSDEFNGTAVDTTKWRVRNETTLSFDQARIMARNVSVSNGALAITARRESINGRNYTTGYLDTIGKFSRQYGRWEIRAKLPTAPDVSRGLWPAFWLRADQLTGEIDVMEAWGDPTSRGDSLVNSYAWTVHENTNHPPGSRMHFGWGHHTSPLSNDFHVFAVDWSPTCLKFSLDGTPTGSIALSSAPWLVNNVNGPMNIRLNMQVGSSYWGMADASRPEQTRLPATYLVDYVRVYRPAG